MFLVCVRHNLPWATAGCADDNGLVGVLVVMGVMGVVCPVGAVCLVGVVGVVCPGGVVCLVGVMG